MLEVRLQKRERPSLSPHMPLGGGHEEPLSVLGRGGTWSDLDAK